MVVFVRPRAMRTQGAVSDVGPFDLEDRPIPVVFGNVGGYAVSRIDGALIRVPHVVGNELQDEFGIGRPWEWASGCCAAQSLKIGEIRGEGAQRVGARPGTGKMLQGGEIGVGQHRSIAISRRNRKNGRQCVEFSCPIELYCRTHQRSLSPHYAVPSSDLPWPGYGRTPLTCEL